MARMLTRCPVCEAALGVSEVRCDRCRTTIRAQFDSCRFCRLTREHLAFVETFLRCEGNLSRVERELGISYPTVRNRLQAALAALGLTGAAAAVRTEASFAGDLPAAAREAERSEIPSHEKTERRRAVLEALEHGELSAEDAAAILRTVL